MNETAQCVDDFSVIQEKDAKGPKLTRVASKGGILCPAVNTPKAMNYIGLYTH